MIPLSKTILDNIYEEKSEASSNIITKGTPNLVIECCLRIWMIIISLTRVNGTNLAHLLK
jgi:hypothetical protein